MSIGEKLRELSELREQGILTEEEFEAQKKLILDSSNAPPAPAPPPAQYNPDYDEPCPPTRLAEAILVTLFCCLPFGIVAIVKASRVTQIYNQQGYSAALVASTEAGKWISYSVWSSVVLGGLYFLAVVASVV